MSKMFPAKQTTLAHKFFNGLGTVAYFLAIPVAIIAVVALSAEVTKVVVNSLTPLFHGPTITFWQGLSINVVLAVIGGLLEKLRPTSVVHKLH